MPCGMTVRPTVKPAMRSEMRQSLLYLGNHSKTGSFLYKCFLLKVLLAHVRTLVKSALIFVKIETSCFFVHEEEARSQHSKHNHNSHSFNYLKLLLFVEIQTTC